MKKIFALNLFIFLLAATIVFSQNKILLLTGKIKEVKSYELKGDWLYYKKIDDKKETNRKMDRYNVFSVTKPDGLEEVIYDPDTALEGDPSIEQVRRYISGEQYGMTSYKTPWNKVEGAVVGFGSGVLAFYGPAVVFANSMIMGRINPSQIPPTTLIEPEVFNSEEFGAGYKKYARNKKIKDTLIFGGIGFAAGFAFFSIIFKD
ncbi:MAG: hypothetical protein ACHQNT_01905 [Bacteroidia bacterium]